MRAWRISAFLLGATALVSASVCAVPAAAQDASELKSIQEQIAILQSQLHKLQREAAQRDAALKKAQEDAAEARAEAQQAASRAYVPPAQTAAATPILPVNPAFQPMKPNEEPVVLVHPVDKNGSPDLNAPTGKFRIGNTTITLGGYIDMTGVYRSANLTSGSGSPANKVPYPNSPNYYVDEIRGTAQQTRLSLLIQNSLSNTQALTGYIESDFNGAATTANSVQSNSYTPRLRQAFVQYDDNYGGWHYLAGQAWSLTTAFTKGMTARSESVPMVIDTNYLPGFVYTRNPQVRVVKDFGPSYHIGFSLESPQSVFGIYPTTASGALLPVDGNSKVGYNVYYSNAGGSNLNSGTTYSLDAAPDMVLKGTADPGWGHYEVYGLGRFFRTQAGVATKTGVPTSNDTVFGGGIGGAATLPVVPKYLDLTGDVLGGYGIGRYGAASLIDGTFQANGAPKPLPQIMGYAGAVGHVTPRIDLYTYVGGDWLGRGLYNSGTGAKTVQAGYGGTTTPTYGCDTENSPAASCSAQIASLWDISVGGWWKFLKGPYGTVQAGLEYEYIRNQAFRGNALATGSGVSNKPNGSDNIVYLDLRYSPWN